MLVIAIAPSATQGQTLARSDFNGDLKVEFSDFLAFRNAFGSTEIKYDLDESDKVDFPDFLIFVTHWEANVPLTEGFNFIFDFGVQGQNQLNTLSGIFTKDMIRDPSTTTKLELSKSEMDSIYRKMIEIDFFNYPDKLIPQDTVAFFAPSSSYKFKVIKNKGLKTLEWSDNLFTNDTRIDPLRELIKLMRRFIEAKETYKKLPPANGIYL